MFIKKIIILLSLIFVMVVILFVFYQITDRPLYEKVLKENVKEESSFNLYSNEEYGFSFEYPKNYYLEEKIESETGRVHLGVILTEDTEENKAVREGTAPPRDGPVSVSVDIYKDTLGKPTLIEWLKETPASNFTLSDGTFVNTTLSSNQAVSYSWSGLYEAKTIATSRRDYIIAVTVNYLGGEDAINSVFSKVIETLKLK